MARVWSASYHQARVAGRLEFPYNLSPPSAHPEYRPPNFVRGPVVYPPRGKFGRGHSIPLIRWIRMRMIWDDTSYLKWWPRGIAHLEVYPDGWPGISMDEAAAVIKLLPPGHLIGPSWQTLQSSPRRLRSSMRGRWATAAPISVIAWRSIARAPLMETACRLTTSCVPALSWQWRAEGHDDARQPRCA